MNGPQLRIQRVNAGISTPDLAARMGIGRTRIPQIEGAVDVSAKMTERYLTALTSLMAERKPAA